MAYRDAVLTALSDPAAASAQSVADICRKTGRHEDEVQRALDDLIADHLVQKFYHNRPGSTARLPRSGPYYGATMRAASPKPKRS